MAKLSLKSKSDALNCLSKIIDKSFDQETMKSLLIAIRESLPNNSSTREMADFVAHSDRDRGLVFNHLATFRIGRVGRMRLVAPSDPLDGYMFIDDLSRAIRSLGLDAKPIANNRQDLLLCYFGILHLARLEVGTPNFVTLKISSKARPQNHALEPQLSIVGVFNPSIPSTLVFYSDIKATNILGNLELFDNDINTMLRVVRDGHSLKIIKG